MIRVSKPMPSNFLNDPKIARARAELQALYDLQSQSRMRFDMTVLKPFKKTLEGLFRNKCAYCESKIAPVAETQIDNFRPRHGSRSLSSEYSPDHYWWLAYEWENLLPSCPVCNKFKRDLFPIEEGSTRAPIGSVGNKLLEEKYLLVDPSIDNPEDHLAFDNQGIAIGITLKGSVTIEVLGLNRESLVANRRSRALHFSNALDSFLSTGNIKKKRSLKKEIMSIVEGTTEDEYVALQRSIFKIWLDNNKSTWEQILTDLNVKKNTGLFSEIIEKAPFLPERFENDGFESLLSAVSRFKRFSVRSIEIKNFRNISNLTLHLEPNDGLVDKEPWLLLLGDNGIGKTSILQAIALALAGQDQVRKLNLKAKDILQHGKQSGFIKIFSIENEEPAHLSFNRNEIHTNVKEPYTYLMGYGSTRLLPKGRLRPVNKKGLVNIGNLFDYSQALINVNTWIKSVDATQFNDKIAPALHDLLDLKDDQFIKFLNGKLCILKNDKEHDLEKVSDGYKSIIGLACDIMKTLSPDDAGYHTQQGIVLIDELGNHLHPRWRMKIVDALRKAFPKLQFIVSTHEPLCLRGLFHGEVNVLFEDESGDIRALDKALLPDHNLLKVDQLLTSDLFGLINTLDPDTEKKYEEYYALLSTPENKRNSQEKQQIKIYTAELSEKEEIGNTPQLQAFYQLINEKYAQVLSRDGFKTKTQMKEETINEVKGLLDDKKLDWL